MRQRKYTILLAVVALVMSSCGVESTALTTLPPSEAALASARLPTTTEVPPLPTVPEARREFEEWDPSVFSDPTRIDNQWMPLRPGTKLVYEGITNEDGSEEVFHQIITIITPLTKVIDGIETVVLWDRDFSDGNLAETELAFFAQDDDGNVWRMGEHPEEYEDGVLLDAPTWLAGIAGAYAGVAMRADPQPNTSSYSQGFAPSVEFIDRALVSELGLETCTPAECYSDVLLIEEFNVEEPGAFQHKYFAKGVGNVRVDWAGTDTTREELELVSVETLSAAEMADVIASALELEAHAYEINPTVYGLTDPIVVP